jgi:hypothetical protein
VYSSDAQAMRDSVKQDLYPFQRDLAPDDSIKIIAFDCARTVHECCVFCWLILDLSGESTSQVIENAGNKDNYEA